MKRRRLTQVGIDKLKSPTSGRVEHRDTEVPGLVLRVNYIGNKSWSLYYHVFGERRRHTIGQYPAFGPKEAREAARLVRDDLARGLDPAVKKSDESEQRRTHLANTFENVVEEYFNTQIRGLAHVDGRPGAKPLKKTWKDLRRMLDVDILPEWKTCPYGQKTQPNSLYPVNIE